MFHSQGSFPGFTYGHGRNPGFDYENGTQEEFRKLLRDTIPTLNEEARLNRFVQTLKRWIFTRAQKTSRKAPLTIEDFVQIVKEEMLHLNTASDVSVDWNMETIVQKYKALYSSYIDHNPGSVCHQLVRDWIQANSNEDEVYTMPDYELLTFDYLCRTPQIADSDYKESVKSALQRTFSELLDRLKNEARNVDLYGHNAVESIFQETYVEKIQPTKVYSFEDIQRLESLDKTKIVQRAIELKKKSCIPKPKTEQKNNVKHSMVSVRSMFGHSECFPYKKLLAYVPDMEILLEKAVNKALEHQIGKIKFGFLVGENTLRKKRWRHRQEDAIKSDEIQCAYCPSLSRMINERMKFDRIMRCCNDCLETLQSASEFETNVDKLRKVICSKDHWMRKVLNPVISSKWQKEAIAQGIAEDVINAAFQGLRQEALVMEEENKQFESKFKRVSRSKYTGIHRHVGVGDHIIPKVVKEDLMKQLDEIQNSRPFGIDWHPTFPVEMPYCPNGHKAQLQEIPIPSDQKCISENDESNLRSAWNAPVNMEAKFPFLGPMCGGCKALTYMNVKKKDNNEPIVELYSCEECEWHMCSRCLGLKCRSIGKKYPTRNPVWQCGSKMKDGNTCMDCHKAFSEPDIGLFEKEFPRSLVQDIIHPSLYCFIKGESIILSNPQITKEKNRYWGRRRTFTTSKYQWMPAEFAVDKYGGTKITSYINNVSMQKFPEFYGTIERIFSIMLPMFERALDTVLTCKNLQVIVKAANYVLHPGDVYKGSWHIEGMSHERIVGSGIYYYDVNEHIDDKGLMFRSLIDPDATNPEDMTVSEDDRRSGYDVSTFLGSVPTLKDRVIVFPNTLQHRVEELKNNSKSEIGVRKILAFFLVSPDHQIYSSKHIPMQQWEEYESVIRDVFEAMDFEEVVINCICEYTKFTMNYADACEHRLSLMSERTATKIQQAHEWGKHVESDPSLCEH